MGERRDHGHGAAARAGELTSRLYNFFWRRRHRQFGAGYASKVKAIAPANLIAYWPQAEAGGTTIVDESGNGRNGAYTGVTLGSAGIGDGRTAASYDGATSYGNVYGASLAAAFNGQEGTFAMWLKVSSAGVWTDGISRRAILFQVDANNRIGINKAVASNDVDWLYVAGATTKSGGVVSFSPTTFFHIGLTWSKAGDAVKFYVNGVQSGATQTGLGTFAGALASTQTILGSLSTTPAQVWSGLEAHVAVWNTPLSAAQMLVAATVVS
jgi:hypothetical protein